jgi:DNA-binding Lrp family transcriptional regulator
MSIYSKTWTKAIDNNLDRKDVELLNLLVKEQEFSKEELSSLSQKLEISTEDLEKRIKKLREKKILLKNKSAIINTIKIWNNYLYVLIKAELKPPVVGLDIDYPTGWSDMMKRLTKIQEDLKVNLIRTAHALHGIGGYDLLIIVSFNQSDEFISFFESLTREGWIGKAETFSPNEYQDLYIFDPVAVPEPEIYDKEVVNKVRDIKEKEDIFKK